MFEEYRKRRVIKKILDETPYLHILEKDVLIMHEEYKLNDSSIAEIKSEYIFFDFSTLESLVNDALRMNTSEIRVNGDYSFIHEISDRKSYKKRLKDINKRVGLSLALNLDSKDKKFSYIIVNGLDSNLN